MSEKSENTTLNQLTLSPEDSLARILATQEMEPELKEQGPAYGASLQGSLASCERDFPALVSRIESALTAARAEQQERERKRAIQIIKDCEVLSAREFDAKYGTASRSSATEAMIAVIRGEEREMAKKPEAPERIWLCPQNYEAATACCHPGDTEYVRADLARAPADSGLYQRALQTIVDGEDKCGCEHSNENCCVLVGEYCPYCIASIALAARAPQEEPHLDFEQRQRATVIAESRGIDLETAQELVYLRDKALKLESLEEDNECLRDESQRRKEELDQIYGHALRGEPSPDDEAIAGRLLRPFDLPLVDYGELAALIASAIAAARSDAPAPQSVESETK